MKSTVVFDRRRSGTGYKENYTPSEKIDAFIAAAKKSPLFASVPWDAAAWPIDGKDSPFRQKRGHAGKSRTLWFSNSESCCRSVVRHPDRRVAMQEPYLSFAKADILLMAEARTTEIDSLNKRLTAHRLLEMVLRRTAAQPNARELTLKHFHLAEEIAVRDRRGDGAYRTASWLQGLGADLDANGFCHARIGYRNRLKRPLDGDELTEVGQEIGRQKIIRPESLNVLAGISANPENDQVRILIRAIDLLVVAGFRVGEALTLPLDCWVEGSDSSVTTASGERIVPCGLLYAAEKVRDYRTKWLPPACVELAKRAIDNLTELCKEARDVARWMEENPGRLKPFEDLRPNEWIVGSEICSRLGLDRDTHTRWKIPRRVQIESRAFLYRVGDVEAQYCRRGTVGDMLVMPSGRRQKLSESLIVLFAHQLHNSRPVLRWLPQPMKQYQIGRALGRRCDSGWGLMPDDLRERPHKIRHWVCSIAESGGLSDVDQAKWMGRRYITQNLTYKHGTLQERTAAAKELVSTGKAVGRVARIAAGLSMTERKTYLDAAIDAVHVTAIGLCLHNFAASPCPQHHACLKRECEDYLRVKGDQEQREALERLRAQERIALERYKRALCDGFYGADQWISSAQRHLEGIEAALAVDETPDGNHSKPGDLVPVFSGKGTKLLLLK